MSPNLCAVCAAFFLTFLQPAHAPLAAIEQPEATQQNQAVGDWQGALQTPQGNLRLWITITQESDGTLKGVMESLDQAPGRKIQLGDVTADAYSFSFKVPRIGASYKASWDHDTGRWRGTFSQGIDLTLDLEKGKPGAAPVVEGMDGTWNSSFERAGQSLRLVIKVRTNENGTAVSLDSPDQMAFGVPVQNFKRADNTVTFDVALAQVKFSGTLNDDNSSFSGSWVEASGETLDLTFTKAAKETASNRRKRPQNPTKPLPYQSLDVSIDNPQADGVTLAGTLTLPEGAGPFPAAILISGSGPQDRDESILGHKPFLVLADHLTRSGIAVLRYDDRGVAKSTGDHSQATSADFATDANAAFTFLRNRADIDADAIGFVGHSEGGLIAPLAYTSNKDVAFNVFLAAPGTDTIQLSVAQGRLLGRMQGRTKEELDIAMPLSRSIMEMIAATDSSEELKAKLEAKLTPETLAALGATEAQRGAVISRFMSPWYRYFVRYDPADYLPAMTMPILAIGGTLDLQVPTDENLAGIKRLTAGNSDVTIRSFDNLNHLFQTAKTGAMGEYRDIEETFAPVALEAISSWINTRFGKPVSE